MCLGIRNLNWMCRIRILRLCKAILLSVLISGCTIMPGMKNIETSNLRRAMVAQKVEVNPTLIPITPTLISDQKVSTYRYRIAPSDVLSVNVWKHPEFDFLEAVNTGRLATSAGSPGAAGQPGYLVNPDGQIFFPLIGNITVGGKTVDQAREKIAARLSRYVPNPQVSVRVADFRGQKVYVLGEVNKPGFIPINDQPLTIADALTLSGWIDPESAAPSQTYVIRGDYRTPLIFWLDARTPDKMLLAERFSLQPGDVLYVSTASMTRINRTINQILPAIQAIWYTQSVIETSKRNW